MLIIAEIQRNKEIVIVYYYCTYKYYCKLLFRSKLYIYIEEKRESWKCLIDIGRSNGLYIPADLQVSIFELVCAKFDRITLTGSTRWDRRRRQMSIELRFAQSYVLAIIFVSGKMDPYHFIRIYMATSTCLCSCSSKNKLSVPFFLYPCCFSRA